MTKRVTLADVAAAVGVDASTVSRVLNRATDSRVSQARAAEIRQAAEQLGYRPNVTARTLATGAAPLVGVVMPSLAAEQFPAIIAGVEDRAARDGYRTVVVSGKQTGSEDPLAAIETLMSHHVSGLIVCPHDSPEDEPLRTQADRLPPMVLVERPIPHPSAPTVSADNRHGGWQCGQWLAQQGCDRVLFVQTDRRLFPSVWTQRLAGLREGLAADDTLCRELFTADDSQEDSLADAVSWLSDGRQPGIFMSSLMQLREMVRSVASANLALPPATRLCGFDRAHFTLDELDVVQAVAALENAPFYVVYSGYEMGRTATDLLFRRLRDGSWAHQALTIPVHPRMRSGTGSDTGPTDN